MFKAVRTVSPTANFVDLLRNRRKAINMVGPEEHKKNKGKATRELLFRVHAIGKNIELRSDEYHGDRISPLKNRTM